MMDAGMIPRNILYSSLLYASDEFDHPFVLKGLVERHKKVEAQVGHTELETRLV